MAAKKSPAEIWVRPRPSVQQQILPPASAANPEQLTAAAPHRSSQTPGSGTEGGTASASRLEWKLRKFAESDSEPNQSPTRAYPVSPHLPSPRGHQPRLGPQPGRAARAGACQFTLSRGRSLPPGRPGPCPQKAAGLGGSLSRAAELPTPWELFSGSPRWQHHA